MHGEDFESLSADQIPDHVLLRLQKHVTTLSYLEEEPPHYIKLMEDGTEETNRRLTGLDSAAPIPDDDKESDLTDSESEKNKKRPVHGFAGS